MENLIKATLEQLAILVESRRKSTPLMKTHPNGQWELLSKGNYNVDAAPKVSAAPAPDHTASRQKMSQLFGELNNQIKAKKTGKTSYVSGARGAIKSYALGLPKGQIDLGNLGKLREAHDTIAHAERAYERRPITHDDMAEIINHHVGDAPSLKHIHDNNGGEHAIETLAHTMGANGDPQAYSAFKFKNPQLHADLLDLVNPGKHRYDPDNKLHSTYEDTQADDPYEDEVISTNDEVQGGDGGGWDNPNNVKRFNNAVVKRAVHRFRSTMESLNGYN